MGNSSTKAKTPNLSSRNRYSRTIYTYTGREACDHIRDPNAELIMNGKRYSLAPPKNAPFWLKGNVRFYLSAIYLGDVGEVEKKTDEVRFDVLSKEKAPETLLLEVLYDTVRIFDLKTSLGLKKTGFKGVDVELGYKSDPDGSKLEFSPTVIVNKTWLAIKHTGTPHYNESAIDLLFELGRNTRLVSYGKEYHLECGDFEYLTNPAQQDIYLIPVDKSDEAFSITVCEENHIITDFKTLDPDWYILT